MDHGDTLNPPPPTFSQSKAYLVIFFYLFSKVLHQSLRSTCVDLPLLVIHNDTDQTEEEVAEMTKSRLNGNMIDLKGNERAIIQSGLTCGQQNECRFFIAQASGTNFKIGLG